MEELTDRWLLDHGTEVEHRYLGSAQGRIHVLDLGHGGRPLLLLPGLSASGASYSSLLAALGRTRRVVAIDRPGTGLSDAIRYRGHPRRPWIEVVEGVADGLDLGSFDLAGHSLGGLAAGAFALEHPDRVNRVVLLSPMGVATSHPLAWMPILIPGMVDVVARLDLIAARRLEHVGGTVRVGPLQAGPYPDRYHRITAARHWRHSDLVNIPRLIRPFGLRSESRLLPELGLLSGRVMVIWGDLDDQLPLEPARRELSAYPGVTLEVVNGAGHLMPFLDPVGTAERITGFIDARRP